MRILGIDPGLSNVGWCFIDAESKSRHIKGIASGTIKTKSSTNLSIRLFQIFSYLDSLIIKYKPSTAASETSFVSKFPQSTLKLGMARGVCLLTCSKNGLSVSEYTPSTVKQAVGGGKSSKEKVKLMVSLCLPGLPFGSSHASDAGAIALCHSGYIRLTPSA